MPPTAAGATTATASTAVSSTDGPDEVYTFQDVLDKEKEAVANIATLIPCKVRIYARTAVYDSREDILSSIRFIKELFPWLKYDETGLKKNFLERTLAWLGYDGSGLEQASFFCDDYKGVLDAHLCGYLILCHRVNGKYVFRACVAEFSAPVSFDQLTLKVVGSSASILGMAGSGASTGLGVALPLDAVSFGAASAVGAVAGGLVGIVGAVFVNVNAVSKEKAVEEALGTSLFDSETGVTNSRGIMEALLVHYLLIGQKYSIEGNAVRIEGVSERELEIKEKPTDGTRQSKKTNN